MGASDQLRFSGANVQSPALVTRSGLPELALTFETVPTTIMTLTTQARARTWNVVHHRCTQIWAFVGRAPDVTYLSIIVAVLASAHARNGSGRMRVKFQV